MVSTKYYVGLDGDTSTFLSDFSIKSEQYCKIYNFMYDADGVDGELQSNGLYNRVVNIPTANDIVNLDKWTLIDNVVSFYSAPPSGSVLVIEVASTPEELGDVLAGSAVQQAEDARDLAEQYRDEALASEITATAAAASASASEASVITTASTAITSINNTATTAQATINTAATNAESNIDTKVADAETTIDSKVLEGQTSIDTTVATATADIQAAADSAQAQVSTDVQAAVDAATADITQAKIDAETAASNASISETNAANSASSASTSATNAANSATEASTSLSNIGDAETNASASATAAATSASNAATSASEAATSASNASTSATDASTSATNAANSATAAATSEANAAQSAIEAATFEPDNFYTQAEVDSALALKADATEIVYNLTGTELNPANGTVQYKALSSNTTLTENLVSGQSVLLRLSGGDTYTVTWFTVTWVTGAAPTLTANDALVFWKEGTTLYGSYIGTLVGV